MATTTEDIVLQKTRELCQTILDQPEFRSIRSRIDAFMSNPEAQGLYQSVSERGESLQHKQEQGLQLSQDEIAEYEKHRDTFFSNPVARGFLDAQQEMHKVQESIGQYVSKTFELGRLPQADDVEGASCGTGCGCH